MTEFLITALVIAALAAALIHYARSDRFTTAAPTGTPLPDQLERSSTEPIGRERHHYAPRPAAA